MTDRYLCPFCHLVAGYESYMQRHTPAGGGETYGAEETHRCSDCKLSGNSTVIDWIWLMVRTKQPPSYAEVMAVSGDPQKSSEGE